MKGKHIELSELSYSVRVKEWLKERYGIVEGQRIWERTQSRYNTYRNDLPEYGGKKNNHASAIYGGLLIFSLVPSLPDQPPVEELQAFVNGLLMEPFQKLGKVFDLNRSLDMWLIDKVFQWSGSRDRKLAASAPDGFITVNETYDKKNRASRYHFTQCPNAEFAKKHELLSVLPLLCNSDFYGIEQIHGTLIRCGTCGQSDRCDYLVVGNQNPIAAGYETVMDEAGYLVSRKKPKSNP
jgi:hypothetical protein